MTYTINDILASMFVGRVERMVADIPGDATEQQIAEHLANNVEGANVPSAAEVLAAVPAYLEMRNKPVVPEVVSMRQARLSLLAADLLDDVTMAIKSADRAAQIEWEFASEVRRDSALVTTMAEKLGITVEQLDQLFVAAATM